MDTPLSDEPELYAIFTATQDITLDELNKELIESTSNNEVNVTMNAVVNSLKANATQVLSRLFLMLMHFQQVTGYRAYMLR